jgi:hypothetical protein
VSDEEVAGWSYLVQELWDIIVAPDDVPPAARISRHGLGLLDGVVDDRNGWIGSAIAARDAVAAVLESEQE